MINLRQLLMATLGGALLASAGCADISHLRELTEEEQKQLDDPNKDHKDDNDDTVNTDVQGDDKTPEVKEITKCDDLAERCKDGATAFTSGTKQNVASWVKSIKVSGDDQDNELKGINELLEKFKSQYALNTAFSNVIKSNKFIVAVEPYGWSKDATEAPKSPFPLFIWLLKKGPDADSKAAVKELSVEKGTFPKLFFSNGGAKKVEGQEKTWTITATKGNKEKPDKLIFPVESSTGVKLNVAAVNPAINATCDVTDAGMSCKKATLSGDFDLATLREQVGKLVKNETCITDKGACTATACNPQGLTIVKLCKGISTLNTAYPDKESLSFKVDLELDPVILSGVEQ